MIGLIDCNNFFASCERVFNPALANKPVLILSNNDGCVIARSNEVKALGVGMGVPYHMVKNTCELHKVNVFSCNFELYGDMSERVMEVIGEHVTEMEVYSIDEAFIKIPDEGAEQFCTELRARILRWTGIPVSIGIAKTKTLAKLAAEIAKKKNGVFLLNEECRVAVLQNTGLTDVWGISHKTALRLKMLGIGTAYDFVRADATRIRRALSIVGLRMQMELQGVPALALSHDDPDKKQIISSRSFGKAVCSFDEISESVASHISRASEKLREQNGMAQGLMVSIRTNRFSKVDPQYSNAIYLDLPHPMCRTNDMIAHGMLGLRKIFKAGYNYHKAGVMLYNITRRDEMQESLLYNASALSNNPLDEAMDIINSKFGRRKVFWGAMGVAPKWSMRRRSKSPSYTRKWNELAVVSA